MTISLPKDAHDYDYEDQVCAALAASGYYLETRLILRKGKEEVLEFDAIATPVVADGIRRVVEVKSGRWGVADLFKLLGQVTYTEEKAGWLIHKKALNGPKAQAVSEILETVPIDAVHFDLSKNTELNIPDGLDIPEALARTIFVASWWQRSADRIAQTHFVEWVKSVSPQPEELQNARSYTDAVAESVFLKSPLRRATALYRAYKDAPQLTSSLISYTANLTQHSIADIRSDVFNSSKRYGHQFAAAQEHRARFAIIKNAYEAIKTEQQKPQERKSWTDLALLLLPGSFQNGMAAIGGVGYGDHVAFFLQTFVNVFGGFYFPQDERELQLISQATGVAETDIGALLTLMDDFFPIPNGWVHYGDGVHWLKGVPAFQRGVGCFTRQEHYGEHWEKQFPSMHWHVPKWHNALYELLEPHLKVDGEGG